MTVREILIDYLKRSNCAGLANPDIECGCGIDNLMPCDCCGDPDECQNAVKGKNEDGDDIYIVKTIKVKSDEKNNNNRK